MALVLIADFDELRIKAVSFDYNFDQHTGAYEARNSDSKEILVLDEGMFNSIYNALHKDRGFERVDSGSAIVDFQNNKISGAFVELVEKSKCSTVTGKKKRLLKDHKAFFDELNQTPIDHIQIGYSGSDDSSDGYGVTYYDEHNHEIFVPNLINDRVEHFFHRLLLSNLGYWFDANGANCIIHVNVKEASFEIEHESFFDLDKSGTLGTKVDQKDVSDLMYQLLNPQPHDLPTLCM